MKEVYLMSIVNDYTAFIYEKMQESQNALYDYAQKKEQSGILIEYWKQRLLGSVAPWVAIHRPTLEKKNSTRTDCANMIEEFYTTWYDEVGKTGGKIAQDGFKIAYMDIISFLRDYIEVIPHKEKPKLTLVYSKTGD